MMSNHTITRKRIFMSDKLARARHTRSADLAASAASPQTQQAMHQVDNAPGEPRPSQGGADQGSTAAIGGSAALISICTIISRITGFARTWAMAFALGSTLLSSSYQVANNLPNQLYELVCGGMIVTAFLPVYVSVKKKLGQRAGNEYASNLLTLVVLLLGAVSLLCMLFP